MRALYSEPQAGFRLHIAGHRPPLTALFSIGSTIHSGAPASHALHVHIFPDFSKCFPLYPRTFLIRYDMIFHSWQWSERRSLLLQSNANTFTPSPWVFRGSKWRNSSAELPERTCFYSRRRLGGSCTYLQGTRMILGRTLALLTMLSVNGTDSSVVRVQRCRGAWLT
ncbi:hypothetical protein BC827DRAFT_719939 [Russula dissimulans]|nr:hypothetical protein BC827DRAFT_719939 [Russula dissimulans]